MNDKWAESNWMLLGGVLVLAILVVTLLVCLGM